ncbi:MAG: helix-turn-helix transcriptional regulator [Ignavibacteria bacterium]|nr:helix-turn-helix transcriptional regulator [Ignavibacteria bacterium]
MILHGYPDYTKPGFNINAPCPKDKWPNMIIYNKTKSAYYPLHTGPLTLKYTIRGEEYFATKQRSYRVQPNSYLIFNAGQKYSARIQSETECETLSVFFRPAFAEEVLGSLAATDESVLDNEHNNTVISDQPVTFMEMIYPFDGRLMPFIYKFCLAAKKGFDDQQWLDEELYMMLKILLEIHKQVGAEIQNIPAAKRSTKIELYKRINNAKDYIDENYMNEIKIEDAAKAACMSNFHFLRLFKNVFSETPYQYITYKRLARASSMIMKTELSITEVCFAVGFQSLSSFSWLFKQKYGISPELMRKDYASFEHKLARIKK